MYTLRSSVTKSNYLASKFIFFVRKLIGLIWKTWIWHDWTVSKTPKTSAISIWKKLNSDFFYFSRNNFFTSMSASENLRGQLFVVLENCVFYISWISLILLSFDYFIMAIYDFLIQKMFPYEFEIALMTLISLVTFISETSIAFTMILGRNKKGSGVLAS